MDLFASIPSTHQVWLLNSPLTPCIQAFATHVDDGRYAVKTTKGYVSCIIHFAR